MKRDTIAAPEKICLWQGGSLWVGRSSGTTSTHAHHALQIALALRGMSFRLKTPADPTWRTYTAAIIPSHQPHAFSTAEAVVGNIFVEPEAHEGRILRERFGDDAIAALPEALAEEAAAALAAAYGEVLQEEIAEAVFLSGGTAFYMAGSPGTNTRFFTAQADNHKQDGADGAGLYGALIVRVGELQVWDLVNASPVDHPFHLHKGSFATSLSTTQRG